MKATHPPKPYLIFACECCGEVQFELDDVLNDEEILYCHKKKLDKDFYIGLRKGIVLLHPYVWCRSHILHENVLPVKYYRLESFTIIMLDIAGCCRGRNHMIPTLKYISEHQTYWKRV